MNTRRPQDGPAALVSRLRDELNALEVRAAVAEQRHRELLEATEDLRAACSQAEGRADEYLRQAAASDGALQEREARLAALDEERAHTRAELTELRAHLLRTTSELGAAQGGLKLSAEMRADLQARLAGLDEERARIRSELGAAQAGLRLSEEVQADLQARFDAARGEAEQLARTLREATAERRDWEVELSRLRRELEQARAHQEAELTKVRGEGEARRVEQQALLSRAQQEHQAEIARVRQQAAALEQTIAGLQVALSAQEADLLRLHRIVARARDYVELIERSERWRFGGMLTRLGGWLLRRKVKPDAVVQLLRLLPTEAPKIPRPAPAVAPLPSAPWVPEPSDGAHPKPALAQAPSPAPTPVTAAPSPPAAILRPLEQMPGTAAPPTMPEGVSADVVVCVHDALEDARKCLESVIARTDHGYSLIVVDDGSGPETASFLHAFAEQHEHVRLIRNQSALGYTCAANQGLRASQADWVILLNSDTIVTTGWLARIVECGESDPKTGIVGPVSNRATWQSVPKLIEDGTWADNPLPYWMTVEDMGELVAQCSERKFPEFPLPSGFCLAVRRAVIERIGYFDEEKYPRGYGEENDYAFRAAKAGFTLRLADHCYVYHAGSRSFTPEGRLELIHQNRPALVADWGEAIARAQDQTQEDDTLDGLRRRVGEWAYQIGLARSRPSLSILFLLPAIVEGTSGGAHMIVDLVSALRALGIQAKVAVERKCRDLFFETYPGSRDCFLVYLSEQELIGEASVFDVLVMTHFRTARLAQRLRVRREQLIAYYVQDYEPWLAMDDEELGLAAESYTLIPDAVPFAMTNWIIDTVREETGVAVHKVEPAFHQGIFSKAARRDAGPVTVCAMVRPRTPRRAAGRTLLVLKRLKGQFGSRIRIIIFGCDPRHPILSSEAAQFESECLGILPRDRAAALMCESDIFIDASDYQAYGLTAVEAMSCGCVPVVPLRGGARSYAQNGGNAVIVDTESEDAIVAGAGKLISDDEFRRRLARNGRRTADQMSLRKLALSTYLLLAQKSAGRGQGASEPPIAPAPLRRTSQPEMASGPAPAVTPLPSAPSVLEPGDGAPLKPAPPQPPSPAAAAPSPPAAILRPLEQMPGTAAPPTMPEGVSADVVVCVHDALEDARKCLESVIARTDHRYSLIVVDDGSGPETASFLQGFAEQHEHVRLIRNRSALGYTCAANQGLRASQADWVILLNSDTIVTTGWLARIVECGESDPKTGIVGPVSNRATWQSVPKLIEDGTWADNPLPYWMTVEDMGGLVAQCSERKFPEFPLPSGFCLAVRRAVIERIGYFDEQKYPRGYGEENDYAFRAAKAGFTLRLADHCYVYHAGSRSFTPEGRLELMHQNRPALIADWGEAIARAQEQIEEDDSLDGLRRRVGEWAYQIGLARSGRSLSILFLLPGITEGTSGGAHMIVDLVSALRALGIQANVAIEELRCTNLFLRTYPGSRDRFLIYLSEQELISEASVFDVLVMAHFRTARLAQRLPVRREQLIAYYVKDYEPWLAMDDEELGLAAESYTLIPDAVPFAMTNWIIDTVREETGVAVHKVEPAFHQGIFSKAARRDAGPVTVCAMVRPRTPKRAAGRTLSVLKRLKGQFGSRIRIIIFGCDPRHPILSSEAAQFESESTGILPRDRAAALMCESDIFIDASDYQAYGLTAVEAMSCGCVPVVPLRGGARSYAQNGGNAVIVDTESEDAIVAGAGKLISDDEFRRRLARNGRRTADQMSLRKLALSTYLLLAQKSAGRGQGASEPPIAPPPLRRTSEPEAEARYLDEVQRLSAERPAVLFLLADVAPGGGTHSVSHAAAHMRAFGLPAAVAVRESQRPSVEAHYGDIADTFLFYQDGADLDARAQDFAIIVATLFTTVPTAIHLAGSGTGRMVGYYVQDYEPYFLDYPPADPVGDPRTRSLRAAAVASYTLDARAVLFAKTDWLCREVEKETGAHADWVEAGIDLETFSPGQPQSGPVTVCAMIRPYSGYRAPELTMRLLKRLRQSFGDVVHPIVFGCDPEDPAFLAYERDFDHENVGVVGREGVAGIFARSHVFIDASAWQGFGRTGVEAMAAGCVPVVPLRGGCVDYAVDGENSLVVDTRDENAIFRAASRLITDRPLRQRLSCTGLQTARRYTMSKNALSIYVLLACRYSERFGA